MGRNAPERADVPEGYWANLDVEELKRRTIYPTLSEENYPSLVGFRLPGEVEGGKRGTRRSIRRALRKKK